MEPPNRNPPHDAVLVGKIRTKLRKETIRDILKLTFKDPKVRINDESVTLMTEIIRMLVLEGALRSCKQTARDHRPVVEIEHIEKILPQLMLDFP